MLLGLRWLSAVFCVAGCLNKQQNSWFEDGFVFLLKQKGIFSCATSVSRTVHSIKLL